jgi:hypothetical protein
MINICLFCLMRATSGRNDAYIVIPIIRIPPIDIRAVRINITDIYDSTIGCGRKAVVSYA